MQESTPELNQSTLLSNLETSSTTTLMPQGVNKALLISGLIISFLLVGGIAYYFGTLHANKLTKNNPPSPATQPQVETNSPATTAASPLSNNPYANWLKYSDSQVGVTLKYPGDWTAKALPDWEFNIFLDDHVFQIPTATEFKTPIQVYLNQVMDTTTNKKRYAQSTVEEAATFYTTNFYGEGVKEKTLSINGHKAIQLSGTAGPGMFEGFSYEHTLIQLDNKVLVISLENNKKFEEIYSQIVASVEIE